MDILIVIILIVMSLAVFVSIKFQEMKNYYWFISGEYKKQVTATLQETYNLTVLRNYKLNPFERLFFLNEQYISPLSRKTFDGDNRFSIRCKLEVLIDDNVETWDISVMKDFINNNITVYHLDYIPKSIYKILDKEAENSSNPKVEF